MIRRVAKDEVIAPVAYPTPPLRGRKPSPRNVLSGGLQSDRIHVDEVHLGRRGPGQHHRPYDTMPTTEVQHAGPGRDGGKMS